MANYRLPMDADGVKYHGTVDQNEENPGHFMYGLDENGNKRIIRTDEQGNVLTRVTGSKVEYSFMGNSDTTETFNKNMTSFSIINDGDNDLTFIINNLTITVKPDEVFNGNFDSFNEVEITADGDFRALVRG